METFINYNSLLLFAVVLLLLSIALTSRVHASRRWWMVGGIAVLLTFGVLIFRPAPLLDQGNSSLQAQLGQGVPTLVQLRSPN